MTEEIIIDEKSLQAVLKRCDYLEQENKELKEQAQLDGECIDKLIEARDMYANALEEIRGILLLPDMPEVKEQTIITSTMLDEIVRANRENKLQKIKQTIYEVLGND